MLPPNTSQKLNSDEFAEGVRKTSPGLRQRTLQIHPTLTCNLRCKHCYSSSAPSLRGMLGIDLLCTVVSDAADMGYETVAVSGGEPFLYQELAVLLTHAKRCGMRTAVTTNGTLLNIKRLDKLQSCLDILAFSLDGPPDMHNEIRQSPLAFDLLLRGVEHVRNLGLSFGFIHTLTKQSWTHLLWLADFAAQQGASLLQIHPLELSGRAVTSMYNDTLDDDLLARVYLLILALADKYRQSMKLQFDVFSTEKVKQHPELIYAGELDKDPLSLKAADLLGVIVVEEDGTVVPISYGFAKSYALCTLSLQKLSQAWPVYVQQGYPVFRKLCQALFEEIAVQSSLLFLNWHELIVARSHTW